MKKTLIFGHRNPDTDSVTSAIALSYLKNQIGMITEPRILGSINKETEYALQYFGIRIPELLDDVKVQIKDVPFKQSNNQVGNYMTVKCTNGLKVSYNHLQYKSQPFNIKEGILVKSGDLLGRTSTTGRSTGGHLHLGLSDNSGKLLDALVYIDSKKYKED